MIFLTSCSIVKTKSWSTTTPEEVNLTGYNELVTQDYIDHLMSFEKIYQQENVTRIIRISNRSHRYLNSIVENILRNNELFFNKADKAAFYVVNSKIPFHFSLPGKKFFYSSALIEKYIKNEAMLYCLMAFELIRSEKGIYKKRIIIPTKTLETQRMLSLLRLETIDKVEVHKWAYYILKRVGIDTDMYLTWLQVKNRNSLDFAIQLGDLQSISREEALYKAFVIEYEKENERTSRNRHRGSSKNFYAFLANIKR